MPVNACCRSTRNHCSVWINTSSRLAPLDLGWKARTQAELALMADLHPLLTKRAHGRDISGLSAYEP